jgi:23S rRNA maturation-related 3'-5' exoribonuclease YhaM
MLEQLFTELCILGAKMTIPQDTNKLQIRKQEIVKEITLLIQKETIEEVLKELLKKARETDYADRTEYDTAHEFITNLAKAKGIDLSSVLIN